MSIVYRIENPDGSGPYRGTNSKINKITGNDVSIIRHPGPRTDAKFHAEVDKICIDEDCGRETGWSHLLSDKVFGFNSKEQLREWFYKWMLIEMSDAGAVIAEYHVRKSDIVLGESQILFRPKNKQKEQYDIVEYFKLREMKIENIGETERPKQDFEQSTDWSNAIAA